MLKSALKRKIPGFPLGLILALTVQMSCGTAPSSDLRPALTISQASVSIGDPHICSDSTTRLNLIFSIYEALVRRDGAGAYQPCLAKKW